MSAAKKQKTEEGKAGGAGDILLGLELNEERYVTLLTKLIGEVEQLQNNPPALVPKEDLAARHVMDALKPYTEESGGPLKLEHITYVEGRGNLIITYPGKTDKTVAFVGSHMDAVPADPSGWEVDPFKLTRKGDQLYGRGTTDSLGHVALITELFTQLAETKPDLDVSVVAVFIASEEAASIPPNAGVEGLVAAGKLAHLKGGPVIWVDSADSQPCIGTAGAMQWHLKTTGKLFHSGLPHKGINPIEMGMEALAIIQNRFYTDYPAHPDEEKWNFDTASTMKPTQIECARGSINQIPPRCEISGDIRLTPFYDVADVKAKVDGYVAEMNANLDTIPTRGDYSKYTLPTGEVGKVEITWGDHLLAGVACSLDSVGYKALVSATEEVLGEAKPYAICGSLPLVREMKDEGFDLQIVGYGLSSVYHGDNEHCLLSDMVNALKILSRVVKSVDEQ